MAQLSDYGQKDVCKAWLIDALEGEDPGDLDVFLDLTCGTDPTKEGDAAKVYRPYFVGTLTIAAKLNDDVLLDAGSTATFGKQEQTIIGWLAKQNAVDRLMKLDIPEGAEATYTAMLTILGKLDTYGEVPLPVFSGLGTS